MPEQMLKHIDETLGTLVTEVRLLRKWIGNERRNRRIAISLLSAAFLVGCVAIVGLALVVQEINDNRQLDKYEGCLNANEGRQGIYSAMDILIEEMTQGRQDDPEIKERVDRFKANLRNGLPQLECELGG